MPSRTPSWRATTTERAAWLTFVVIGGGPTGVEMAGTMSEIAQHTLAREFRRIDPKRARVILLEGSSRILGAFVPEQSARARSQLERLGVDVRTDCEGDGDRRARRRLRARGGGGSERIEARTVIWAAGVAASPLGAELARGTGASLDRAGRVVVAPDLSLPGHPEIAVVGDLAAALSHGPKGDDAGARREPGGQADGPRRGGQPLAPPARRSRPCRSATATTATWRRSAARRRSSSSPCRCFGTLRFSGLAAWLFWLFAHIYFLIGFRNRLMVMIDWAWAYFTYERGARVVAEPDRRAPVRRRDS